MSGISSPEASLTPEEEQNSLEVPATTFPKFEKLCAELRNKIWELALPSGRNIFVKKNSIPYRNCAPPALLSVCRESRDIALGTFRLFVLPDESLSQAAVYINLNPGYDRLYIIRALRARVVVVQFTVNSEVYCQDPGKPLDYFSSTLDRVVLDLDAPLGRGKHSTFKVFQLSGHISERSWLNFIYPSMPTKIRKTENERKLRMDMAKRLMELEDGPNVSN